MANLLQHFSFAFVLIALTTGLWRGGEGRNCEQPIQYASCEKDHPSSCVNICRSGLYFPPYLLVKSVCEAKFIYGHYVYYCKCIWECDGGVTTASVGAVASPPMPLAPAPSPN